MDGQTFGPYTAKEALKLGLLDDTLVREEHMEEWLPASKLDFEDLAKKELKGKLSHTSQPNLDEEAKRQALKDRLMSSTAKGKLRPTPPFPKSSPCPPSPQWPTLEFKANFNEGLNSIGGKIIITATQLIFKAHSINFGDLSDRVFEIRNIVGYKKGFLSFMYISFVDGNIIKLTVWDKKRIIDELEARRQYLILD